ncbi:membrane protein insertase YidC [Ramlibacter algicola]|uniref:Membrane protein insertase YidC n=1 Tax=Ramlibacter algicola TaxID=2795217 RepID=A0A934UPQ6_9BURK|nr:membrane protein insertase YidC [Ramlibacter algicola]MBK0391345.1 membrane protein insertase YidC [Ramlibacter algicola]
MNDIRRSILWVIFGFSMVLLWDQWQIHNGRPPMFGLGTKPAVTAASGPQGAASGSQAPASSTGTATSTAAAVPGGPATATPVSKPAERFTVDTDLMRLTFSTEGGTLVRNELLKIAADSSSDKVTSTFVLLQDSPERVYIVQSGLTGGDFPNHTTVMTPSGDRQLKDGANELNVRFESPEKNGVKLVKTYTLKRGHYDVGVKHEVVNTSGAPVSPRVYFQILRDAKDASSGSSFYSTFTGPAVYTEEGKYHTVKFEDIEKNKAEIQKTSSLGWVAMVQHYFTTAWILPQGVQRDLFVTTVPNVQQPALSPHLYAVGMIAPLDGVAPGASKAVDATLFSGPQEEKTLAAVGPELDRVKDYGHFYIIAKPLYWLLDKIHGVIGNWGWSIMVLVLIIKIAFYWLQAKGYESMARMKAINPRVMQLRERYKDNPQQMQQEMMRIYKEEKVNPLGGCLPIVVQIPVFIALYWVLLSTVEMRNAPWIGWIRDLAAPDPYFILPFVMTLTTLLQTALNPAPPDPMQAKMMWIMPLAFSVMFFFFPAGLVLYWITNNVLSIAQQWLINYRMGVPPQFNLPKFGKAESK